MRHRDRRGAAAQGFGGGNCKGRRACRPGDRRGCARCCHGARLNEAFMAELNIVEKVIALEGVDLLSGLEPDQLARIASISTEVHCAPGKVVLDPAKPLDALYVVLDGGVLLTKDGSELHTARQNEVLGAWALFDSE